MEITSRAQERQNPSTTFIQADTTTFKQLVQTLTGTPQTSKQASPKHSTSIPPIKTGHKKQSSFKLHERMNNLKSRLMISPMGQDFPLLALSPVTPLVEYPFGKSSSSFEGNSLWLGEEKVISEKGFYLHPSPGTSTPKGSEPLLLPLFPVTSPRVSDSSY